jgi:hypothetical protein
MASQSTAHDAADQNARRREMQDTVERLVEDFRRAEIIVQQFKGQESQNALFYKM